MTIDRYESAFFCAIIFYSNTNASSNKGIRNFLYNKWNTFPLYFQWINPSQWPNPFNGIKNSSVKTKVIVGAVGALAIGTLALYFQNSRINNQINAKKNDKKGLTLKNAASQKKVGDINSNYEDQLYQNQICLRIFIIFILLNRKNQFSIIMLRP